MLSRRHASQLNGAAAAARRPPGRDALRGLNAAEVNWDKWSRHIESRRRRLEEQHPFAALAAPRYLAEATFVSFHLDGLDVAEPEVHAALTTARPRHAMRSRTYQRLRNHAALLHHVDQAVRHAEPIELPQVIRWYASISCGLCPADLAAGPLHRLDELLQRINSPELRPAAAVQEAARWHAAVLADPLVPSFNGILARLLLRYHLGRCNLPPVLFHPDTPRAALATPKLLLPLLMEQLDHSFDVLQAPST
jgi:hypothetical protein